MEILNKIKDFFKKHIKLIIFLLCFAAVVFCYNLNIQTLNFVLKRGTVLEYSIPKKLDVQKKSIKEFLYSKNIKYSFVEEEQYENKVDEYINFDFENKKVDKAIFVALPYKLTNENKSLANEVSDYIFKNYPNSKLISINVLSNFYPEPYCAFLTFIGILFISIVAWMSALYLIYGAKNINEEFKINTKNYFSSKKEAFLNLIKKTKEKGLKYLINIILFDEKEDDKEVEYGKEIFNTIIFVVVALIIIRSFIGEPRWIPSGSMHPTILEHDRVFVEKLEHPHRNIKRGDILVFYPPETKLSNNPIAVLSRLSGIFCQDIAFIKRVVGMPNDKFEIKKDANSDEYRVYINDVPLNEPYITSKIAWSPCNKQMFCGPFIIPDNHYFMMGDNRDNSHDSRFWGFLDGKRIIGRANFMFWPIRRINVLTDKYFELNKQIENGVVVQYNYILDRY